LDESRQFVLGNKIADDRFQVQEPVGDVQRQYAAGGVRANSGITEPIRRNLKAGDAVF